MKNIQISKLQPFKNHPFKLYEGQRFDDMCSSIRENGVLIPIIVRPINEDNYEILSGHNRVEAAKVVELEFITSIIREDLSDEEALIIVTESNLIQRSFADLSHSEKAVALKVHMDAIKAQGKRNDLIDEINDLLNAHNTDENEAGDLLGHRLKSRDIVAAKYDLSPTNLVRYIRLCELNINLLNRVDSEEIGLYAAVSISYLSPDEQAELEKVLSESKYKVDMKKAEILRSHSKNKKLTSDKIIHILSGEFDKNPKSKSPTTFTIKRKIYSKFFDDTMKTNEVEAIIVEALEEYFQKRK